MKELEKTKRISIASTLFILVVVIGLLTYKRPKNTYILETKSTLEKITNQDYFTNQNDITNNNHVLVDIRSAFEFEKGHLKNALNIHTPSLLQEENLNMFKEIKSANKTVVLYGKNPEEINLPFLLLSQLGFDNVKLLPIEISYYQNKLLTKNCDIEIAKVNVTDFINNTIKRGDSNTVIKKKLPQKKKIITRQKKKKVAEGGC